jgi:transcriptional regulator with XRE-family HTH domain
MSTGTKLIREIRDSLKLSQTAFGALLDKAQSQVSEWEGGTREISIQTWLALIGLLSIEGHRIPDVSKSQELVVKNNLRLDIQAEIKGERRDRN